jgi:hypothetical protein
MARPAARKAPARSTSALATKTRAKTLPRSPAAFLAQLDQIAADIEASTDDRDAAAVAVAVRQLVALARQKAPEGARLTPTRTASAAGLCWRSGGSHEGDGIEAAPHPPSPSHLEMAEATLEALAYLNDAQETARRLASLMSGGIEPRDLPDAQDDVRDLAVCLDQLAAELGRCCYQLTGHGGGYRPRGLVSNALDLAGVVEGLRSQMQPGQTAKTRVFHRQLAGIASRHFARSA